MPRSPGKAALRAELVAQLEAALAAAVAAHQATVEGATHAEARSEGDKDTRALEQTYLARGQAQRVIELQDALAALSAWAPRRFAADEPVALGALVTVAETSGQRRLLIAPAGGGNTLAGDVQVVTLRSPLGQALAGKQVGDEVDVGTGPRARSLELVDLA